MDAARLEVQGSGGARRVDLTGADVTIGRAEGNVVRLDDDSVSRRHAVLTFDAGSWSVTDLGSANGTRVNDEPLTSTRRLVPGDVIGVGSQRLVFRSETADTGYLGADEEWSPALDATDVALPPVPAPTARADSPGPATPVDPPPSLREPLEQTGGTVTVTGVARAVVVRRVAASKNGEEGIYFRVDRYDASGNRLPAVGVEMAPFRSGHLTEGEEVEVVGRYKNGTLHARRVRNLATGADLTGQASWEKWALGCAGAAVMLFILGIAISIAYSVITQG